MRGRWSGPRRFGRKPAGSCRPGWRGAGPGICGLGLALALALATNGSAAAVERVDADSEKLAFLINFSKFVEWPRRPPNTPVTLCVLGHPAILAATRDRKSARPVLVAKEVSADTELRDCHMLFIGAAGRIAPTPILERIRKQPVLSVSDLKDFAGQGGMIGLLRKGERLKFEINLTAANAAGLKLSSRLVQLAVSVR